MADLDDPRSGRSVQYPGLFDLVRFVFYCGLIFFLAWIAGTGRVAYTFVMLVIAAALVYAVLDLVDMEIVKRKRSPKHLLAPEDGESDPLVNLPS
jgi:hypothetical protein